MPDSSVILNDITAPRIGKLAFDDMVPSVHETQLAAPGLDAAVAVVDISTNTDDEADGNAAIITPA